jgi:CheY-like chemotaxis protein
MKGCIIDPIALLYVDAHSNRKMLMLLLGRNRVNTESAENGQQAIDKISGDTSKFQLVFMDNIMPIMVSPLMSIHAT